MIHSSIIVRSELSTPFHFIHEKPSCVISTYLFGCLGSKSYLSPSLSLSVLQCTFSPCDFWLDFSRSTLFSFPYLRNCSCIEEGDTLFALFVLTSRANCDQLIPFPFSAKKPFLPLGGLTHCSVPAAKKIPSQKNCISKSPVEKSSVVPSNVCLGSATRITNFTNHSHHYTASTTRCKE